MYVLYIIHRWTLYSLLIFLARNIMCESNKDQYLASKPCFAKMTQVTTMKHIMLLKIVNYRLVEKSINFFLFRNPLLFSNYQLLRLLRLHLTIRYAIEIESICFETPEVWLVFVSRFKRSAVIKILNPNNLSRIYLRTHLTQRSDWSTTLYQPITTKRELVLYRNPQRVYLTET